MSGHNAGASAPIRILLIEDSDLDAELIAAALEGAGLGCRIDRVMTREAFAAAVAEPCHDLILADYVLPTFDGLAALDHARAHCPDIPFVFVSGTLGEDVAVEALKTGATDYVVKQRLDRLPRTVLRALAEAQARSERRAAAEALRSLNESLEARVAARTAELAAANAELRREIIERERIEEALRQAQRLEAVGQLTSGVAHDFNNLLTVIAGNLEFLGRAVLDERSRRRIDTMRAAADRGARLTAQLLAFSRRQRLEPVPVRLNDTVATMRDLLQSSIGGAVEIAMVLEPGLWPALADPTQIELIILNLAINARDAMAVGGRLTIETANATLDEPDRPEAPPAGEHVMIALSDTGSGISPEVLVHVFEPFFTTKEVGKGSGLGLAQVYGFAKQSGGGVRIETRLGEGTTVRVFLPRAAAEPEIAAEDAEREARPPRPQGERPVVLVVDDDDAVREITVTRLSEAGYLIQEAGSGPAALRALAADPAISLVVLDFAMPGMNGAEAACEIRRRRPGLPVIFATGYADRTALMQVESVCEDRIVQKPFRGAELERKVDAALSERPALRLVAARSARV
ncbi:response regulator [Methylobacterium symbioticum]|uniref:histidine kinase n=1 Tax=Methylobacterium symbioticum TaxID=2584084 RepID=A0A509EK01_9HYPH|nr:response regulator [Methylobacterium symbioticum]VUD73934.1 Blue-light-activated protein [Methylobacterium symbioticum]